VNQCPVRRAVVANNICVARAGSGIEILSSPDISINGNMIIASGPCNHGIAVRSEAGDIDNLAIRGNDVLTLDAGHWATGIRLAASQPHEIGELSILDNTIEGSTTGIEFVGPGFRQTPTAALNRTASDVTSPLSGVVVLPNQSIVTGGANSRGGGLGAGRTLAGIGSPVGRVTGNIGDVYQRIDNLPGPALFVKEAGTDTSGWQAK
jgi:hypothetical protein